MAKKFALDIFKLLADINSAKSGDVYEKLTEVERKSASPLVIMRWMTGTSDERQIMMLNEFVNPVVFPFAKHQHLLMQLLQVSSSKTGKRFYWQGIKSGKKNVEVQKVIATYLGLSTREVKLLDPLPSNDEILDMAISLGYQKEELTKLKAELKNKGE